jgi:hypothetical protein
MQRYYSCLAGSVGHRGAPLEPRYTDTRERLTNQSDRPIPKPDSLHENETRSRQRTATIRREQTAKNTKNAFKNSNNLNVLGFKHLVDIEGVTSSIPVAPTTQSVGIELRRISVHLSRGTRAFRVHPRLCIGLQATKIRFSPVRLCIEKFRS